MNIPVRKSVGTLAERLAKGKSLRSRVPRSAHAQYMPAQDRPDPVALLEASNKGRLAELIPLRYGRMAPSPLTFLRGSAGAMAFDLAATPASGIPVQLCGDCHLMNFGCFGTPERNFIFDLTDFDETIAGPWEWDVKRLAASVVAAGRSLGIAESACTDAALACVAGYRKHMRKFARMDPLEIWYTKIDGRRVLDLMHNSGTPARDPSLPKSAYHKIERQFPRLTEIVAGQYRFRDHPPLVFHSPRGAHFEEEMRQFLAHYRATLPDDRRPLLDRYHMVDLAVKIVGVGSVGMRCAILLLSAGDGEALVLQYKEAGRSVLEPFLAKSKYANSGQRVVSGQRLLQSASDLFLGWASDEEGRDFYFRQLRDMKTSIRLDGMTAATLSEYAELCGYALARGHAKSGDPALISGYLGRRDSFDRAVAAFASAYADQTERDYAAMLQAIQSGRLVAQPKPP